MGVTAGIFLASILLKEMRYLVYIIYLWSFLSSFPDLPIAIPFVIRHIVFVFYMLDAFQHRDTNRIKFGRGLSKVERITLIESDLSTWKTV
jgi:hypothetical protein